jgi:hypothetical protein
MYRAAEATLEWNTRYTEEPAIKRLSYFFIKMVRESCSLFDGFVTALRGMEFRPAQIFIIRNNFMNIRPAWLRLLDTRTAMFVGLPMCEE